MKDDGAQGVRGNNAEEEKRVRKAVFENVNRTRREDEKGLDEALLRAARVAARTGTYFEKRASADGEDVRDAAERFAETQAKAAAPLALIKTVSDAGKPDSIYRRVAKFLILIGVDEAAKIIPRLTEEQIERIIPEIASIRSISDEDAKGVLEEFDALVKKSREGAGVALAKNILTKAYGEKKAGEVLKKSVPFADGKPFSYLEETSASRILSLLSDETAGVQATVLSRLAPKKAAAVISLMEEGEKASVALRLAKMKSVELASLKTLDSALHEKLLAQNTAPSQKLDGRSVLAEILKRMDPSSEEAIVSALSRGDPALGEDLRQRLFTEEDIISSDDRYLEDYLGRMSDRDIAVLIYGKDEPFREKLLSCVSHNRSRAILEEEQLEGTVAPAESEKATTRFYADLRRAWEKGDLRVIRDGDDEEYV